MATKIIPVINFIPVPTPTIPFDDNKTLSGAQTDEVMQILELAVKKAADEGQPANSVYHAAACGADHHVHIYVGTADSGTGTSHLLHDFKTDVLC